MSPQMRPFRMYATAILKKFSKQDDSFLLDLGSREMINQTFVPKVQRGPQLTFQETGNQNTFMFAQSNTFIQIDGDMIQTFQLRCDFSKRL